jgi:hypothetical protein
MAAGSLVWGTDVEKPSIGEVKWGIEFHLPQGTAQDPLQVGKGTEKTL